MHWRVPLRSGLIFAIGLFSYVLLACAEYTLTTLVCYLMLALLLLNVANAKIRSKEGEPPALLLALDFTPNADHVKAFVNSLVETLQLAAQSLNSVFQVANPACTIKTGVALFFLAQFGKMKGETLLLIGFIIAFAFPPIYERQKEMIDAQVAKVAGLAAEKFKEVEAKLPPAVRDILGKLKAKQE